MVREYDEDGDEIGGCFFKTIEEAEIVKLKAKLAEA